MWRIVYTHKALSDELIKGEFELEYLKDLPLYLKEIASYQDYLEIHIYQKA